MRVCTPFGLCTRFMDTIIHNVYTAIQHIAWCIQSTHDCIDAGLNMCTILLLAFCTQYINITYTDQLHKFICLCCAVEKRSAGDIATGSQQMKPTMSYREYCIRKN